MATSLAEAEASGGSTQRQGTPFPLAPTWPARQPKGPRRGTRGLSAVLAGLWRLSSARRRGAQAVAQQAEGRRCQSLFGWNVEAVHGSSVSCWAGWSRFRKGREGSDRGCRQQLRLRAHDHDRWHFSFLGIASACRQYAVRMPTGIRTRCAA